jgi:acyl carrier protein
MSESRSRFEEAIFAAYGDSEEIDSLRLIDMDSLLVTELVTIVEESVGRAIDPETFAADTATVKDLLLFSEMQS